jgi:hypothetical protein
MLFLHNETGELFEFLLLSVEETGLKYTLSGAPIFTIGEFTLYGKGKPKSLSVSEFANHFTLIGLL